MSGRVHVKFGRLVPGLGSGPFGVGSVLLGLCVSRGKTDYIELQIRAFCM